MGGYCPGGKCPGGNCLGYELSWVGIVRMGIVRLPVVRSSSKTKYLALFEFQRLSYSNESSLNVIFYRNLIQKKRSGSFTGRYI